MWAYVCKTCYFRVCFRLLNDVAGARFLETIIPVLKEGSFSTRAFMLLNYDRRPSVVKGDQNDNPS